MAWESYVRVYTRDMADMIAVGWQGRFVFYELLRKVDHFGVLDFGVNVGVVAELLRLPTEVLHVGLPRLLNRGCVVQYDGALVIPNFMEAHAQDLIPHDEALSELDRRLGDGAPDRVN